MGHPEINNLFSDSNPSARNLTIFVLDADCNASTCVVQSLGRAGHHVDLGGISDKTFSFHSRYVKHKYVYPSPLENRAAFLEWFRKESKKEKWDYILPLSDVTLYPLRELDSEIPGIILPSENAFDWFFDKAKTIELASRCQVPFPDTQLISSIEEFDGLKFGPPPYFVKLTRSKLWIGAKGYDIEAKLARSYEELRVTVESLVDYGPVLVQEYKEGDGVGIEMLCREGRTLIAFAHKRIHEYPLTGGGSSYRVSIDLPPDLLEASERMVKEIKWTGVAMVEFKKDGDRFSLMEVNGRFWGSLPLSYRAGIDFPRSLIEMLEGLSIKERPGYRPGIYSRRFSTDFSWFKRNLVADKKDPYTKSRPLGWTIFEYGRFLVGKDHWDHASFSDPAPFSVEVVRTLKNNINDLSTRSMGILVKQFGPALSHNRLRKILNIKNTSGQPIRILSVCYGNICRSPFTERLLRQNLDSQVFEVRSCGFVKKEGRFSPEDYAALAYKAGVDLSTHRSNVISRDLVDWADLILLMDVKNWSDLKKFASDSMEKVLWLGAWNKSGEKEIQDPYGKSKEEMGRIIKSMEDATLSLAKELTLIL